MINNYPFEFDEVFVFIDNNAIFGIEPNRYSISNFGRVHDRATGNIIPVETRDGKSHVYLHTFTENVLTPIDVLVGIYFVPGREENKVIIHVDGDPSNDFFMNLEWVRYCSDCTQNYRIGANSIISEKDAELICTLLETGNFTYKEISIASGINQKLSNPQACISNIYCGRSWRGVSRKYDLNRNPEERYSTKRYK